MKKLLITLLTSAISLSTFAAEHFDTTGVLYREEFRPRYHFTPRHRWIGDPCGLHKFNGQWRGYSWGAIRSNDLLHWTEVNNFAIKGMPKGTAAFTGSVVIDRNNTSGFGPNTPVAAYTMFFEDSKKQTQAVAFSDDGGDTFHDYDRNPVIDIWSTEFRDPTVIRDSLNNQWVMLVAKALEKKVAFYRSDNLRDWQPLSEFGPLGDSERSWECPDMFQLTDPRTGLKKWVLVLSINWARQQYFIGDWDGKAFTAEQVDAYPLYLDQGFDHYASRVFQDFDGGHDIISMAWLNTWDYAHPNPLKWGKGIWSIPRVMTLANTPKGLRLAQHPIEGLKTLRGKPFTSSLKLKAGVTPIPAITAMGNVYEANVTFSDLGTEPVGLYLCQGTGDTEGYRLKLSYDPASEVLTLDRTNCAQDTIPHFRRLTHVAVPKENNSLTLRIFVDKSTVEIFTPDGLTVLSLLTYARDGQDAFALTSLSNGPRATVTAYPITPTTKSPVLKN